MSNGNDDNDNDIVTFINQRIKNEICYETLSKLSDQNLMSEYMECNSVKKEITKLRNILEKYDISISKREKYNNDTDTYNDNDNDNDTKSCQQKIINEYLIQLIPAGTKGVIRGNKFNQIVRKSILDMNLDSERYDIQFEKKCKDNNTYVTSEIPDWFILEKATNKIIIGMNQLDLVSGGHQLNRGYKYLIDNKHNTNKSKLLCVICNEYQFKNNKNKAFQLFKVGFQNNTICYLKNLHKIIKTFFL